MKKHFAILSLSIIALSFATGQRVSAQEADSLFDRVAERLQKSYYDEEFRNNELPKLIERYRPLAEQATTLREQRQSVHEMLSHIPATHMGLLSQSTYNRLMGELFGKIQPTFGFELISYDGKYFAHNVLEGGPADNAGLRRGDRIVLIDGELVRDHPQLDWRSDDSYLIDPPVHFLKCPANEITIDLTIEPTWGETAEIRITSTPYSAFEAARASAMVIQAGEYKLGHIHFWMIHVAGVAKLLKEKLEGDFADCDAVIVDFRGRGGNGSALPGIYEVLSGEKSNWNKPVVALVNRYSRSAKEVIAYELKRQRIALVVGERTAGAVIPASFVPVGHDSVLMFPAFRFGKYTALIEGIGVQPDVWVNDAGPYSQGADPLLGAGIREAKKLVEAAASSGD